MTKTPTCEGAGMYGEVIRYYQKQGDALREAAEAYDTLEANKILDDVDRVVSRARRAWLDALGGTGFSDLELAGKFFMYQEAVETYSRLLKRTKLGEM